MNKPRRFSGRDEILDAEEEYFISSDGHNLYQASIERTERWGKYGFMIIGIGHGKAGKRMPYGLASFSFS